MPRVSVIIPSYNYAGYIGECLSSLLAQTLEDFEVVVVDDCSTDDSLSVIRSFLTDPRVTLVERTRNQGISVTQNIGIESTSAEFVCILNADDVWRPPKLERQVAFLESHPEFAAVFDTPTLIDKSGRTLTSRDPEWTDIFNVENRAPQDWIRHFLFKGNCLCHPAAMLRRSTHAKVGLYDPRFSCAHDFELWMRMLVAGEQFSIDPGGDTCFRVHGENSSWLNTRDRMTVEACHLFRHLAGISNENFFYNVFPECQSMGAWEPQLVPYYLSKFLVEVLGHKLFANILAQDLLWEFVESSERVRTAEMLADFSWPAFHGLIRQMRLHKKKNGGVIATARRRSKAILSGLVGEIR